MPPPPLPPVTPAVKTGKDREPGPKGQTISIPGNKSTPAAGTRPTIKLKIGSGTHDNGPVNGVGTKTPAKPKKLAEPIPSKPLPSKPPTKEDPKVSVKHKANGISHNKGEKRKKTLDAIFSDDDILASAAPLKKRPSPLLGPTAGGPSTPSPAPSQPQRNGSMMLKLKAPKATVSPPTSIRPEPSPPSEPIRNGKGKEPEGRGTSVGPKPKVPASAPVNVKRCKDVMKVLQKIPDSAIFARPVDPIADGCPTYDAPCCIVSDGGTNSCPPSGIMTRSRTLWTLEQSTSASTRISMIRWRISKTM